ncbi:MAG: DUF1320 domain-containing protein [Sinobacteraceae bacterium]|nr:DUF1320 domain-containing protein [Nevskiaceae bacterium]
MAYATQQDLYNRFGQAEIDQLADRNGDGAPDPGVIDAALADASDTIDAYIGAVYALPLAVVPPVVNRLCCDLARYRLYADAAPELVQSRHDAAVKLLQAISAGTATLGLGPTNDQPPSSSPKISGSPRTFTGDTVSDYTAPPAFPYA